MVLPTLAGRLVVAATFAAAVAFAQSEVSATLTSSTSLSTGTITTTSAVLVPVGGTNTRSSTTSFLTTAYVATAPVVVTYAETPTATPTPEPVLLDTKIDPGFGVLGALLILTGLPTAFWGHKNRWSSFFIVGFYTLALTALVLILKFGVVDAINPPSTMLRGLFVFSCAVAGFIGGGIAVLTWKLARYAVGGWGGFALALWIQCFHVGGVIRPIGFRWLFYIALITVGFVACTIPKWHYHVMLVSTAFVGATAIILGVDCYSSAGLKEFYVYNLGFDKLFPKFYKTEDPFQLTQIMQIELGLIAAIFLMGAAVQLRVLAVLKKRLQEISDEEAKHEEEVVARAAERFDVVQKDLEQWEKEHGRTRSSNISNLPLLGADGLPATPGATEGRNSSQFSLPHPPRPAGTGESSRPQTPGLLPSLELGDGIKSTVPQDFMTPDSNKPLTPEEEAEVARRDELLAEISSIRRSIDVLRSATGTPLPSMGSEARSRVQSFGQSLNELEARYSSSTDAPDRQRVHSMDLHRHTIAAEPPRHSRTSSNPMAPAQRLTHASALAGTSISRPSSTPMEAQWDAYTRDRKVVVPGATDPTPEAPASRRNSLFAVPTAVSEALARRQKRESAYLDTGVLDPNPPSDIEMGKVYRDSIREAPARDALSAVSSDDQPLAAKVQQRKIGSLGGFLPASLSGLLSKQQTTPSPSPAPVTILPPARRGSPGPNSTVAPSQHTPRTRTFEELTSRHRDKMRAMQNPLSKAEQEQAKLDEARERWERSKKVEKTVMERKEQDSLAKRGKAQRPRDGEQYVLESSATPAPRASRHGRSSSADKIGGDNRGSRRMSTMKVEDWQQYQQNYDQNAEAARTNRDSTPNPVSPNSQTDKRRSRTTDYVVRSSRQDPPN